MTIVDHDTHEPSGCPALEHNYLLPGAALSHTLTMDDLRERFPFFRNTLGDTGFWSFTRSRKND